MKGSHAASVSVTAIALALVLCTTGCAALPIAAAGRHASAGRPASGAAPAQTIQQAISDRAQRATIAFDALGFLTGSLGSDSFFPPGKVADFWGFQYLRDHDPSQMGHNTDFLTKAALNMYSVLTTAQRARLRALAVAQAPTINDYAYERFTLMEAFRRLLAGDVPAGTTGLDEAAVKKYSAQLYRIDGQMSYDRAAVYGPMLASLSVSQRARLGAMVGKGMTSWPSVTEPADMRGLSRDQKVAVMTYAGDLYAWYAGSLDADVYFCPERHGTYFGSFYLKDAPAVGNAGYSIPTTATADMGDNFINTLDATQATLVTGVVSTQKPDLLSIVDIRRRVAQQLRLFKEGKRANESTVLGLMERYGELDGDIAYQYATAFCAVDKTLTAAQKLQLTQYRTQLVGSLEPTGAYLYAQPIPMPRAADTDFLFGVK